MIDHLINPRTICEGGYCYKLAENGTFGMDVPFSDNLEINESEMSVVIPFADGNRRDGVGDLLEVAGIDTSRHVLNPIVLFDHGKAVTLPIGLAEDPKTKQYTVKIDQVAKLATCKAFIYQGKDGESNKDHALFCEQLFDLMAKRFVRAGSIGYQVKHYRELYADYETGTPKGLHLLSVLMLEASAVVMPANADTVRKMLCMPKVCGKPLSPYLIKSLTPYTVKRQAMMGYEAKALSVTDLRKALDDAGIKVLSLTEDRASKKLKVMVDHSDSQKANNLVKAKAWHKDVIITSGSKTVDTKSLIRQFVVIADDQELYHADSLNKARQQVERLSGKYRDKKVWQIEEQQYDTTEQKVVGRQPRLDVKRKSINTIPPAKWKPGLGALKSIREKYRTTKTLRRRLKKSVSGASIVHVDGKNLDKVKQLAESKGLKFSRLKTHESGAERVKLTGDDNAIDEVAKAYGRPMMTKGVKSLPNEGESMADETVDTAGEGTVEPYGAQCLRRLHQDHSILMKDYHDMLGPLEHEHVKGHIEKTLQNIEKVLTETETHFGKHYKDLPGLEGAMDSEEKDLDEGENEGTGEDEEGNVVAATSEEEDEPTPDEVVEGMDAKSLRLKYRHKSMCHCGKKSCGQCNSDKNLRGLPAKPFIADNGKIGISVDGHPMMAGPFFNTPSEAERYAQKNMPALMKTLAKLKKALTEAEAGKIEGELDEVKDDLANKVSDTEKALEPHERQKVEESHGYLKELSEAQELTAEHKMKAYHYHKALEPIAGSGEDVMSEEDFGSQGKGIKSIPGSDEWAAEEAQEPEHKSLRKAIGEVSSYMKDVAFSEQFGDEHRQKALDHHNAIGQMMSKGAEEPSPELTDDEPVAVEPGDMGEKSLITGIKKQDDEIATIQANLNKLMSLVG